MDRVSKTKVFLIALVIIIGLVFLNLPSISNRIKGFFYLISGPIQMAVDKSVKQIKNSWDLFGSLKTISKENIKLEEEIKKLEAQNAGLKEIKEENEFLRSYFNLSPRQRYQVDVAHITGRDFQGLEKYILINKGELDGIKKNMPIIALENILIGKTIEVFNNSSKILLITSLNNKVPVLIQESRTEGLTQGTKENFLIMNLVPKNTEVEKNQTVITSGIGGIFPKGLLIGKVLTVKSLENEMFQKIEIMPAVDTEKLERVFIIKD